MSTLKVTVHIGDEVHEVGTVFGGADPVLIGAMVGDWAEEFGAYNPDVDALHADIMAAEEVP